MAELLSKKRSNHKLQTKLSKYITRHKSTPKKFFKTWKPKSRIKSNVQNQENLVDKFQ